MKIVVGLWNPGLKYEKTRHNIGFVAVDKFIQAEKLWDFLFVNKFKSEICECVWQWEKVLFVKPMTFMNNSGWPLSQIMNFYKVMFDDIIVVHDEIDFPVGKIKLKIGGSAAGHNGIWDIIAKIWTKDFRRIRIGVDRPANREQVVDYVLGRFGKVELDEIENIWVDVFGRIEEFLCD